MEAEESLAAGPSLAALEPDSSQTQSVPASEEQFPEKPPAAHEEGRLLDFSRLRMAISALDAQFGRAGAAAESDASSDGLRTEAG